jgi:L-iditol 2-dehydrogenase
MYAMRLEAIGRLEAAEVSAPAPERGQRLLPVRLCALCRTDAKAFLYGQRDLTLPRILGHEVIVRDGNRDCVAWPGQACGVCPACAAGRENLCASMRILGFHRDGGLAEAVRVDHGNLLAVPGGLPAEIAVLAEPLACGVNALERLGGGSGEALLVVGGGPAGLLLALAAKFLDLKPLVVESDSRRLARADSFREAAGIDMCERAGGKNFPMAVNAASTRSAFESCIQGVETGGRVAFFSGLAGDCELPAALANEVHYRELSLLGAYGCTRAQMRTALDVLAAHREAACELLDEEIDLAQTPRCLRDIAAGRGLKRIVRISG